MLHETRERLEKMGEVTDPLNFKKETSVLFLDLQSKFEAGSITKIQYISEVHNHIEKIRNTEMPAEAKSYLNSICNEILTNIHS